MTSMGPYILPVDYKKGDPLIKNEDRWNKNASLLFIDTPGIVGFSTDTDETKQYNDEDSMRGLYAAFKDFMKNKAPELKNNDIYVLFC